MVERAALEGGGIASVDDALDASAAVACGAGFALFPGSRVDWEAIKCMGGEHGHGLAVDGVLRRELPCQWRGFGACVYGVVVVVPVFQGMVDQKM